ncbi:restriction endonuclease subunit S [Vibrio cholerae]|nr:restriction endonuclease subunit S [Vibrio parahaemolyticus]ELK0389852.1 restriction endonuclease subunit S [Vibrio cholerae]
MESITSTPKYDQYIDSGYEWIGEIPLHWDLVKLGSCLSPVSVKNCSELPLLSITREQGVIERDVDDQESNHNFIPDDLSGYKKLEKGQFGMNKMKAWQGSYGVSKFTGIVSPAYFVFDFTKAINPEFFNWAIRSKLYISFFGSASDGVRIGQWDLSKTRMKVIPFVLPSEEEQSLIANFLDKKATQINDAIAIKEQQINLLKERKQIIIQQAVTQGLDPNVPMKDSGVDWIGKIPAHWDTLQSKRVFLCKGGFAFPSQSFIETGIPVLRISNIQDSSISTKGMVYVDQATPKILREFKTSPGDLIFCMTGAGLGKVGILPDDLDGALINQRVGRIDVNGKLLDKRFAFYVLTSLGYQKNIRMLGAGLTDNFPNISSEQIASIEMAIPPIECQIKIVEKISEDLKSIDDSIGLFSKQIDIFKEYKTSLINSAVTGKIKITPEMVKQ